MSWRGRAGAQRSRTGTAPPAAATGQWQEPPAPVRGTGRHAGTAPGAFATGPVPALVPTADPGQDRMTDLVR